MFTSIHTDTLTDNSVVFSVHAREHLSAAVKSGRTVSAQFSFACVDFAHAQALSAQLGAVLSMEAR